MGLRGVPQSVGDFLSWSMESGFRGSKRNGHLNTEESLNELGPHAEDIYIPTEPSTHFFVGWKNNS